MRLNVWPCMRPMPLPIHGKHARTSETCCQNGWRDADSVRTVYCRQVANRRDHYTSVANVKRPSYVWCCASHQVLRSFIDCVFLRQCSVWRAGPASTARPRAASGVYEARAGCPACPAYFWSDRPRFAVAHHDANTTFWGFLELSEWLRGSPATPPFSPRLSPWTSCETRSFELRGAAMPSRERVRPIPPRRPCHSSHTARRNAHGHFLAHASRSG